MKRLLLGALSTMGALLGFTGENLMTPNGGALHSRNGGRNRHPRIKPLHRRAKPVRRWKDHA